MEKQYRVINKTYDNGEFEYSFILFHDGNRVINKSENFGDECPVYFDTFELAHQYRDELVEDLFEVFIDECFMSGNEIGLEPSEIEDKLYSDLYESIVIQETQWIDS